MLRNAVSRAPLADQRRRNFVDPALQGALLRQAVVYWLWASATFSFVILVYRVFPEWVSDSGTDSGQDSGRFWYHMTPYFVASAVLFPIVMFHAIRFSNRFAGPMVRVRDTLKQLARRDTPPRLVFRKNDFWSDIADDINEIAAEQGKPSTSAAPSRQSVKGVSGIVAAHAACFVTSSPEGPDDERRGSMPLTRPVS
jgi:hypothetical protein